MSYRVYSENKKSLVFPIMGDGYVHLDYSKHIPTDSEEPYGLWGHKDSFMIETIVTPYDVNGFAWLLGGDYETGAGDASSNINADPNVLELPFNDKYFSAVGNESNAASSRSKAYFSHMHVGYLAEALDSSETVIDVSRLEDLDGGDYIRIDNEKMRIVSTARNFGNGYQVTVARGFDGTTATTHDVNAPIYTDNRKNHKMSLFYNPNCEFYLKNMTRTNMNQPAEYKIGCTIKGKDPNGITRTVTIESNNPVITADKEYYGVTVDQPALIDSVFGKPIYLGREDRVKYHKMVDSSANQIYFERLFNGVDTIADVSSNVVTFSATNNTISRASGSWTASMRYIKVVGSDNNDGYFRVRGQSGGTLTLETTNWVAAGGANTGNNLLTDETHNSGALKVYYTTRATSTHGVLSFADGSTNYNADSTSALDMVDRVWRGRKLYGQINSSKTFSTSLQQKEPISLGYIDSLYAHSSGNKVVYIYMAACRLTKPVRTTTETIFYVDDARDLSVGDSLRFFDEVITIGAISGNAITVARNQDGGTARTSKIDGFGGGDSTPTDYYIDPLEEYNFSRTLYKILPSDLFDGVRLIDGSGNSISNSDNYGGHLIAECWKEASYVLRPFYLGMSYDSLANRVNLVIDGDVVETSIFSEGDLRIHNIVGDGSTTVTINTIGAHGLSVGDWISIDGTGVTNLDGVFQLPSQTVGTSSFTITTQSAVASATTTAGTLKDVTIRTSLNFTEFEFDQSDCFLGSNGNDTLETRRASQFMGEIHEFSITKDVKTTFQSLDTLLPNFRNTLLYFRFEGEDS